MAASMYRYACSNFLLKNETLSTLSLKTIIKELTVNKAEAFHSRRILWSSGLHNLSFMLMKHYVEVVFHSNQRPFDRLQFFNTNLIKLLQNKIRHQIQDLLIAARLYEALLGHSF